MLHAHAPESWKRERCNQVAQAEISSPVAFAAKSENGIGAGIGSAIYAAREMNSKKCKLRIRDGIDQRAHQRRALRDEIVVLAAKRNNDDVRFSAGHASDAVAE